MKEIIIGTNRPGSNTKKVALLVEDLFKKTGETVGMIDVADVGLDSVDGSHYGGKYTDPKLKGAIDRVNSAEGLILVVPEYNGSYPGVLKYFIDHWKYPESFEARPVCFVGLGGRFGGLRPVEHLQQVFGFRNAYIFPERVFIADIWNTMKDGKLADPKLLGLLESMVQNFQKFCLALSEKKLDANSRRPI